MDIERAKRYRDKLNIILERIADIEDWTSIEISDFISDKKTRLAVYKAFQELVEASFDIVAMACRDSRIISKDDYANVEALYQKNILDERLKNALIESNGLRNRLVHRYNALDDRTAFESILELLPDFKYFTEVMDKWLEKML
ncbi:MAG: DUF86 domain-containing protein [Candidatus Methanoperedens sp.]|nr:DUF86 domain-containing protein [Candidatus Methanoperedens sp.]